MKGIFRSEWIIWFDTNQGASRMDRRTLNWNLWMRTMLEAFADPHNSVAFVDVGSRIIMYTVSLLSRGSLVLLLRRSLRRLTFQFCVGVPCESALQVEPEVVNILRRGNGNDIEEDRMAGPTTERECDTGTLGSFHLEAPLPAPALDTGEVVQKDLRSGVRVRVTGEDTSVVSKRG
jgi:hypothetical protein